MHRVRRAVVLGLVALGLGAAAPVGMDRLPAPRPAAVAASVPAQAPAAVAPAAVAQPRPTEALAARLAPSGVSGWMLADLDTGEVLDARSADAALAPASVAKLPTAAYALAALGAGHVFETRLVATGEVRGGVLEGDLALVGGGDPELDSDGLLRMVMALRERGISRVAGRFVVDAGPYGTHEAIDPGQPEDAPYNPSVGGLSLNFNRVRVEWPKAARAADIRVTARAERLDAPVSAVTVATVREGPALAHGVEGEREVWRLAERELRRAGGRWLPVRRPAAYAGDVLRMLAATHGIALPAPVEAAAPEGAEVVATVRSRPLAAILEDMLFHSTNLTAEAVGLAASERLLRAGGGEGLDALLPVAVSAGAAGTAGTPNILRVSADRMNGWASTVAMAEEVSGEAGVEPSFRFANHSGLSLVSRVTPEALVGFLRASARAPAAGLLPGDPRRPGGVGAILRPYNIADKQTKDLDFDRILVVAKTGTMNYVRGLAGYVVTPNGRRLAFAVFSNDLETRADGGRNPSGWMGRAKGFERALLREWVRIADRG